ncbi:MAG: hypothetical protein WCW52_03185 [Elusimicrobiales bacterium]|jgi:hypothetical protein
MKRIRSLAVLPAALLLTVPGACALEITSAVPVVSGKRQTSDFVFSRSLAVKGIAFENGAVVMPVAVYKEREYADIRLLSKTLYGKLESCFSGDKCSYSGKISAPKLSVLEVKTLKSRVRVANVALSFDGDLSVVFGVLKKISGGVRAAYPENFEAKDPALRDLIETKVKEGFAGAVDKKK